jgi:hypothetical protein
MRVEDATTLINDGQVYSSSRGTTGTVGSRGTTGVTGSRGTGTIVTRRDDDDLTRVVIADDIYGRRCASTNPFNGPVAVTNHYGEVKTHKATREISHGYQKGLDTMPIEATKHPSSLFKIISSAMIVGFGVTVCCLSGGAAAPFVIPACAAAEADVLSQ